MPVVEIGQHYGEYRVGDDEKEAVEEEALEIQGEGSEGRLVLLDEIKRGDVRDKSGEEHVDHEGDHHLADCFKG